MDNPRKWLVYNGKSHLEVDDLENETTINVKEMMLHKSAKSWITLDNYNETSTSFFLKLLLQMLQPSPQKWE
jgi:hypothetical protein